MIAKFHYIEMRKMNMTKEIIL